MKHVISTSLFVLLLAGIAFAQNEEETQKKEKDPFTSGTFSGLKFRSIGPALTSGRISDVAVNLKNKSEWYVTVACGGVWKTTNSGTTFEPIFDGQAAFSIGCVTIDPNNPHVVWVGTGENNSQRSVSWGDGVYRSDDGGKSWKNMGLKKSEHIAKVVVDPRNSNHVYVAAQGPLWGPGGDRGLYKSTDSGKNWKPILTISENTGVTDLVFDPRNPDVLYAASYQRRRHVWTLINGGPESMIFKSTDAGATWDTLKSGIPSVDKGRIGLAISPVNPDVLYAIIEAAEGKGGFFRSTNRGASWEKRNDYVSGSPQYYQELVCDPKEADRVYSLDTYLMITDDGGKNFKRLGNKHRHVDDHAMWIDPDNTSYYLVGGDGGLYESWDRGQTWRFKENLPVTQFYRVSVDNTEPFYWVYGGTQDNYSLGGPSRTIKEDGIMNEDWLFVNGGDGFEPQIDPTNPDIVYAQWQYGGLVRFDRKSGERVYIQPQPGKNEKPYRWNWDSPLLISPHSPTRLYFAANVLFRSDDRGDSWKAVSGDLTREIDRNALPVMGKVWGVDAVAKNASTSLYGNIVSLTESPLKEGVIAIGCDDGLIRITENGGSTWTKIERVSGVPDRTYVSHLAYSQHERNTIYAAFDNHKNADFKPYALKSTDNGKTWSSIAGNLPADWPVYHIAEDHVNPNLLFAGTEYGVFFTIDGGKKWTQLKGGLPPIAVRDIAIQKRENDLVLATFGRGFYILDDYTPIRSVSKETLEKDAMLFPVKDALMFIPSGARGKDSQGETFFTAENPPFGATFTYSIKEGFKSLKEKRKEAEKEAEKKKTTAPYPTYEQLKAEDEEVPPHLLFTITDEQGELVRKLTAPVSKGVQRISWDLKYPSSAPVTKETGNKSSGLLVMPGRYSVALSKIDNGVETKLAGPVQFTVKVLNNVTLPASDRAVLVAFQRNVSELQRHALATDRAVNELKSRLEIIKVALEFSPDAEVSLLAECKRMMKQVDDMQRVLNGDNTLGKRNENQPPSIMGRMGTLSWQQASNSSASGKAQLDAYEIIREQLAPVLDQLRVLVETDLKNLESKMDAVGIPWTPGRLPKR